jgi:predicted RNase H-like HicB family nuclease
MTKRRFKLIVRRDPEDSRAWLVNVARQPGAHMFGLSLAEVKRHGVEVIALWFELECEQFEIDFGSVNSRNPSTRPELRSHMQKLTVNAATTPCGRSSQQA